jgi:hypothetical protein
MRPVEHRPYMPPSGGGQPYPASRDMTTPFPFGSLLAMLWDIKPRGNGKPWAMEPAVEDTDGRSASERTRPRFFFFGLCSTRPPYRGAGFRYRIRTAGARANVQDLAFSSLAYAPPDPPTGVPASGIGYGFYQV